MEREEFAKKGQRRLYMISLADRQCVLPFLEDVIPNCLPCDNEEYILLIRLDNTQLPGILPTAAYLEWPPEMAATVADILARKLGREPYVPPRLSVSVAIAPTTSPVSTPATGISKSGKRGEHAEDALLQSYIREIEEKYAAGNARELSYRLALETLLKQLVPEIVVMHEPDRKAYGTPDYVISQKTDQ